MLLRLSNHIFLFFVIYLLLLVSCKKDTYITSPNASITISADSIKFDTVFTSVGSITQIFKINNNNNQQLLLNKVKLMGGASSSFKININGIPGPESDNITIDANDSIYIFVTVTINPNQTALPFLVSDSILIAYNGNNMFVQLQAYGQNAHFYNNKAITSDTILTNDLPYVILGQLLVDSAATLTIQSGCNIYVHANAPILVNGSLIINGTKQAPVVFTGDRLDAAYINLPASWPGIYFQSSSSNNVLTHTSLRNANQAIVVTGPASSANPQLTLHRCIINNSYLTGLSGIGGSINADNCLISNCGNNISITYGGIYNFVYCTVAGFGNQYISQNLPVLQISNQDSLGNINSLNAQFTNCIFWGNYGSVANEVSVNETSVSSPNISLNYCLYKNVNAPSYCTLNSCINNTDPMFDSVNVNAMVFDFHVTKDTSSPVLKAGVVVPGFPEDLDDNPRVVGTTPDLGCYERQ